MMESYTSQQRVEIIKIYYRNSKSVASTLRALSSIYGRPSRSTIERLVDKFESRGKLQNVVVPVRQKCAHIIITHMAHGMFDSHLNMIMLKNVKLSYGKVRNMLGQKFTKWNSKVPGHYKKKQKIAFLLQTFYWSPSK